MARQAEKQLGYHELTIRLQQAEHELEAARLTVANDMAEAIIADGGMTIHAEQFLLALHGVAHYYPRGKRLFDDPELNEAEAANDVFSHYDAIEQSVAGTPGSIMMHRNVHTLFAQSPHSLSYHFGKGREVGQQPLRFLVRRDNTYGRTRYNGYVLLPVLKLHTDGGQRPNVDALKLAELRRPADRAAPFPGESRTSDISKSWHIGKQAIVTAAIRNYSTDLTADTAFLQRLDDATDRLNQAGRQLTQNDWSGVWQRDFRDGGGD